MPFTGQNFDQLIDIKTDRAYTGYWDSTKKNRVLIEAITKAIETKTAGNDSLFSRDDLFGIYKTNAVYVPVNNEIDIIPGGSGITDYFHLLNMRCLFVSALENVYITIASNTTPIRITVSSIDTPLRTNSYALLQSVTGNTNANGLRYLKQYNYQMYGLYSDSTLSNPVAGNGAYSGTSGRISQVVYNYAGNINAQLKPSRMNNPDIYNPGFEVSDTVIKVYPLNMPCTEVTVDYISTPVYIDVTDTTIDLLETYSMRFLDYIADEMCKLLAFSSRDGVMAANESSELIQQP